jgi:glucokinase
MSRMSVYLGVEIGGTKLQVVVGDEGGRITDRRRFNVSSGATAVEIRQQVQEGVTDLLASQTAAAIGVGFGGPVNRQEGRIAQSHQVEGWSGFAFRDWLEGLAKIPVRLENDANLATLAEATCGAGRGFNPVFYFNLGSGVGGGIAVDGHILHGRSPGEGEFGHLRLDRSGTTVEQRCSGWAIDRRLRDVAAKHPDAPLARLIGTKAGGEARHLRAALDAGDQGVAGLLAELAADLGYALSHVVHLIHPEMIVLGGGLSLVGEPLRAAVAQALEPHLMKVFRPGPPIALAKLGEDAVPVGALLLAAASARG